MEYLLFPKDTYNLTQGYGSKSYSHQNRKALDVSSKNGNMKIYAPFSGYVAKKYVKSGNAYTIWLVSNNKIMCADGKMYYVVAMFTHPSEISKFKVNQTFKQGQYLFNDGDTGKASGKHLDMEIAIYSVKSQIKANWEVKNGDYVLINAVNPCKYMLLKDDTKIINDIYNNKKYEIKYVKNLFSKGQYLTLANMNVRKGPSVKYNNVLVKDMSRSGQEHATLKIGNSPGIYKKNTIFDAVAIIYNSSSDIWAKTYSGYVNIVNGSNYNCQKV